MFFNKIIYFTSIFNNYQCVYVDAKQWPETFTKYQCVYVDAKQWPETFNNYQCVPAWEWRACPWRTECWAAWRRRCRWGCRSGPRWCCQTAPCCPAAASPPCKETTAHTVKPLETRHSQNQLRHYWRPRHIVLMGMSAWSQDGSLTRSNVGPQISGLLIPHFVNGDVSMVKTWSPVGPLTRSNARQNTC